MGYISSSIEILDEFVSNLLSVHFLGAADITDKHSHAVWWMAKL